jgi:hypothetical protein
MVELLYTSEWEKTWLSIKEINPQVLISLKIPFNYHATELTAALALQGVEIIHLYADLQGNSIDDAHPRFIKDLTRDIHLRLVDESLRDKVTLLVSGGIAMAEHVAKAIICGADGVILDLPLLIALECRLCKKCLRGLPCPVKIGNINIGWATQRIMNLMAAWRSQLLEVLGAMGLREVRRLRGEMGRAMLFQYLEQEIFAPLFGQRIQE